MSLGRDGQTPTFKPQVVLPGERLNERIAAVATDVKIGRGIDNRVGQGGSGGAIVATKAGVFSLQAKNKFFVENNQKRCVKRGRAG
jgi:hypothetical protein